MLRTLALGLLLAVFALPVVAEDKEKKAGCPKCDQTCCCAAGTHRVFELRTYHTNPGKLADLHKRFHDHTCQLLKKHGAQLIGFWTPQDEKDGKSNKLVYMVAFCCRDCAQKAWKAFGDDPEWKKVYAESHKNGVLVGKVESVFLDPTDYSPIK
jgi:hypothetical protein